MRILNLTKKTIISKGAKEAHTLLARLKGLLGRTHLRPNESLIIHRCQQVHMLFMKFPLDVIFVDKKDRVVGLAVNLKPFELSSIFFRSSYAIEVVVGTIQKTHTQKGDHVKIEP